LKKHIETESEQQLAAFISKAKFFINIKRIADEPRESLLPARAYSYAIRHSKKGLAKTAKKAGKVLPRFFYVNPLFAWFFKMGSKVLDKKIEEIRGKIKSKYILFQTGVPQKFDLPQFANPIVSIIIPVHNKYDYTLKCIYSILQHSPNISYEIIIADDASTDETRKIISNIKNCIVNRNKESLGFLKNCNAASLKAKGKYLVFLNNDTIVQPNWLLCLIELMEKDDKVGLCGSKLVYPEGMLQEAGGIIWSDASGWNYGRLKDPTLPEYNYVKEVDYISGASIMVRKTLWDTLGGFDERYIPAYYEDTDLAFEIRKQGFKVVYQPKSVAVHFEGISHGTDTSGGIKGYQIINKEKLKQKWKKELEEQFENGTEVFVARDRSRNKKTILVIDHYVPEFDQDAGSKSCFQYIKLFTEMGLNVKFIGDNYMKKEPYTSALQQLGVEVLYGYEYEQTWKHWIVENAAHLHYVFLNRPHITAKYIDHIKDNTKAKIIYYGHDLHFLREERQYAIQKKESLLKSAKEWKKKELDIFYKSDLVLYPSFVEIDAIAKIDSTIKAAVIPLNTFDDHSGSKANSFNKDKKDLLFIGGFNHPPNADAVSWFASEIFPQILAKEPSIRFLVVGSKVPEHIKKLNSNNIVIKGYVSNEELITLYESCRIVVAPLRFGAGVKGKIIEAIYYRNAVITTPIGAEGLDTSGGQIIVANDNKTFANEVLTLYNDEARLAKIFDDCPSFIKKFFSKENAEHFVKTKLLNEE
jgi:GT2 family glycosyltransferase/glycosyltransferase involved in cell wall biosynthesis